MGGPNADLAYRDLWWERFIIGRFFVDVFAYSQNWNIQRDEHYIR